MMYPHLENNIPQSEPERTLKVPQRVRRQTESEIPEISALRKLSKAEKIKLQRELWVQADGKIWPKTINAYINSKWLPKASQEPKQKWLFDFFSWFWRQEDIQAQEVSTMRRQEFRNNNNESNNIPYNSIVSYRGRTLWQRVTPNLEWIAQDILQNNPEIKSLYNKVPWWFEKWFLRLISNIKARWMEPRSNFVYVINRVDNRSAIAWIPSKWRFITTSPGSCVFWSWYGNIWWSNSTPLWTSQLRDIRLMDDPNKVAAFSWDQRSPIRWLNGRKQGLETIQTRHRNLSSFNYWLNSSMGNSNNASRLIQFHGGPASIWCTSYTDVSFMQTIWKEIISNFKRNIPAFEENALW